MQRILAPGQIETLSERSIPRIRLPDRARIFAARAERLRHHATRSMIGDYLRLMATLADAQQAELAREHATLPAPEEIATAHAHRMPLASAAGRTRTDAWHSVLHALCTAASRVPDLPPETRTSLEMLRGAPAALLDSQADALLAMRATGVDAATAPFVMAALQVVWTDLSSRLAPSDVVPLDVHGVCPVCGTLPVASVVRADKRYQGYRYLHCALCATEWHLVRATCTVCDSTAGIAYHTIDGADDAVRAESCDTCHAYRKIVYQEKDRDVEPAADDLASLGLDVLMCEAGYHRGSGYPLLWLPPS